MSEKPSLNISYQENNLNGRNKIMFSILSHQETCKLKLCWVFLYPSKWLRLAKQMMAHPIKGVEQEE